MDGDQIPPPLAIDREGWLATGPVVPDDAIDALVAELGSPGDEEGRGGRRNLLDVGSVRELARSGPIREVAEGILGAGCLAVRGLLFDKTPGANWKVPWHQDLTVAVAEKREAPGFGPWSVKERVDHAQAPAEILNRMLAIRVHLDDCGPENGPLRVLPGSHWSGKLDARAIEAMKGEIPAVACLAPRGGLIAFRPLLLHASSAAASPRHRRVVHLEFAAGPLPGGLRWRWSVPMR